MRKSQIKSDNSRQYPPIRQEAVKNYSQPESGYKWLLLEETVGEKIETKIPSLLKRYEEENTPMSGMKPWLTHGRNNPKAEEVFRNTLLSVGFCLLYNGDIQW